MIEVTFYRDKNCLHPNTKHKGQFVRKFNSIEELVMYCFRAHRIYIHKTNLTYEQQAAFRNKFRAMFRHHEKPRLR